MLHGAAEAASISDFVARTHRTVYDTVVYRLFVPAGYSAARRYPLILTMHGVGERGSDNNAQLNNNIVTAWITDTTQAAHPCFIVSPQCPSDAQWADFSWSAGIYRLADTPISKVMRTVVDLLDSLEREFSIDTTRMYASGLSMGGCGTWDIIARCPAMFAAAVPVCGVGDSLQAASYADMSIWAFHGAQDGVVPVTGTRYPMGATQRAGATVLRYTRTYDGSTSSITQDSLARAVQAGQRHIFTEYTDGSHFIWDNSFLNPLLPTWLFAQVKEQSVQVAGPLRVCRPAGHAVRSWAVVVPGLGTPAPGRAGGDVYELDGSRVRRTPGMLRVHEALGAGVCVVQLSGR